MQANRNSIYSIPNFSVKISKSWKFLPNTQNSTLLILVRQELTCHLIANLISQQWVHFFVRNQNTILINPAISTTIPIEPVTNAYYIIPLNPANGPRFKDVTTINTNATDATFHEIGHIIYQGQTTDNVLNYNNNIRKIIGLPNRPPDKSHNRITIGVR